MSSITVELPTLLRPAAAGRTKLTVPTSAAGTVSQVLDALGADYPVLVRRLRDETGELRRHVNLYLDGEDVRRLSGPATTVRAGQEILIIQSVAGG